MCPSCFIGLAEAPDLNTANSQFATGKYHKWAPVVCRTNFKTDTIRIEMDTSAETGAADWNYVHAQLHRSPIICTLVGGTRADSRVSSLELQVDYVEIIGSRSIQANILTNGVRSTIAGNLVKETTTVIYVPHEHANGVDTFEYQSSDCMVREGQPHARESCFRHKTALTFGIPSVYRVISSVARARVL